MDQGLAGACRWLARARKFLPRASVAVAWLWWRMRWRAAPCCGRNRAKSTVAVPGDAPEICMRAVRLLCMDSYFSLQKRKEDRPRHHRYATNANGMRRPFARAVNILISDGAPNDESFHVDTPRPSRGGRLESTFSWAPASTRPSRSRPAPWTDRGGASVRIR